MVEQSLPRLHRLKPFQTDAEFIRGRTCCSDRTAGNSFPPASPNDIAQPSNRETPPKMSMLPPPELPILGFITTRSHRDHGYFGGLLLINTLGRPLEFHCTLPILPSRAQSILYGTSLDGFYVANRLHGC